MDAVIAFVGVTLGILATLLIERERGKKESERQEAMQLSLWRDRASGTLADARVFLNDTTPQVAGIDVEGYFELYGELLERVRAIRRDLLTLGSGFPRADVRSLCNEVDLAIRQAHGHTYGFLVDLRDKRSTGDRRHAAEKKHDEASNLLDRLVALMHSDSPVPKS